jgi:hypothetical protein
VESLEERDHQEYLDTDGRIIFRWILERKFGALWTGFIWLRTGTSVGLL